MYAHRVGLKAEGVGAPTALYFTNCSNREYIALLVHDKRIVLLFFYLSLFFLGISILLILNSDSHFCESLFLFFNIKRFNERNWL